MTPSWTEDTLQQLLYEPQTLLADAAWRELIAGYGGLDALYAHLRTLTLPQRQRVVLATVLDRPLADADAYANALHVHRTTFYRQQRQMFRTVAALLAETAGRSGPGVPAAPLSAFHQLRPPISDFMGRGPELATLLDAAGRGAGHEPRAVIGGIHGMGGVGKTELAFALTHRLRAQFPDAQLVLDLRGARETPMMPAEALQAAIRAFVPQEQLPADLDALQQRYRSLLDGKRVLMLLDDARDAAQVRPLVPPVGCLLLVTSRQRWTLPGMVSVQLAPLGSEEGPAFLRQLCARLTTEEAATIAVACDQLPLALRVSGSLLAINPALSAARYIQRLGDARRRLEQLRDPDDAQLNVAASLELSYAALEHAAQLLLRQLAVLAADFDTELALATAALPGEEDAEDLLHALLRRNVILYDAGRDRWRLHDLMRSLALGKLAADEEAATRERYMRATLVVAQQLKAQYLSGGDQVIASLARFDQERPHVDELYRCGDAYGGNPAIDRMLVDSVIALQEIANVRYHFGVEWRPHVHGALHAAQRLGLYAQEGVLLRVAGVIEDRMGDIPTAIEYQQRALHHVRQLHEAYQTAAAQVALAQSYYKLGSLADINQAIGLYEEALVLYQTMDGSERPIALCLNNLGAAYQMKNDADHAAFYFAAGLDVARTMGDRLGTARGLCNVAAIKRNLGQHDEAIGLFEEALVMVRELGALHGEMYVLRNLATSYEIMGALPQAYATYEEALALALRTSDQGQEAGCKWKYGLLLASNGERERALPLLREAVAYSRERLTNHTPFAAILQELEAGGPVTEEMMRLFD